MCGRLGGVNATRLSHFPGVYPCCARCCCLTARTRGLPIALTELSSDARRQQRFRQGVQVRTPAPPKDPGTARGSWMGLPPSGPVSAELLRVLPRVSPRVLRRAFRRVLQRALRRVLLRLRVLRAEDLLTAEEASIYEPRGWHGLGDGPLASLGWREAGRVWFELVLAQDFGLELAALALLDLPAAAAGSGLGRRDGSVVVALLLRFRLKGFWAFPSAGGMNRPPSGL